MLRINPSGRREKHSDEEFGAEEKKPVPNPADFIVQKTRRKKLDDLEPLDCENVAESCFVGCNRVQSPRLDFEAAPINLTWIVLFTLLICSISFILDDLFFKQHMFLDRPLLSNLGLFGSDLSSWRHDDVPPSSDFLNSEGPEMFGVLTLPGFDDNEVAPDFNLNPNNFINVVVTSKTMKEKHALIHGGAAFLLCAISLIWCLSAYITLNYIHAYTQSQSQHLSNFPQTSINENVHMMNCYDHEFTKLENSETVANSNAYSATVLRAKPIYVLGSSV